MCSWKCWIVSCFLLFFCTFPLLYVGMVVRMRLYIHTSPHVRLVVLIGSTGENKGLVANILLVLIPEGKIYLKVQKWMVRSSLISSQLSKSLPARSILGLRRIVKRSNPCELPTFIACDRLLHIWKTCLFNFWKKVWRVLRECLRKHLNDMIFDKKF